MVLMQNNRKDIVLKNIFFSYSDKTVFESLSAVFKKGRLTSLIGPNGSGKTTLLKIICGIQAPSKGEICIGNSYFNSLDLKKKSSIISSVFSSDFSVKPITVDEFVLLNRFPLKKGFSFSKDDYDFKDIALKRCRIENLSDKILNHLSAGELQLALLAGCIAKNSDIIIMDEPVSHLDISHAYNIYSILRAEADRGKTVIASVHDINTALRYSDIITAMKNFSIFFSGSPDNFLKKDIATKLYKINFEKSHNSNSSIKYIFPA
ncbi:MAG TPA: ABC transporter ATP-binding protein [Spirochaetota bacterium]|jgi:iron complex transport system ATP-binding protein|nr:ABC transporter ATP-binding protein [Spirochaetota bacterium]